MNIKQAENMSELIQMYNNGVFDVENESREITVPREGHVFDEDESVKWNREQRDMLVNKKKQACQDYFQKRNETESNLWNQVDSMYSESYGSLLTKEQVSKVRVKAYSDRHSEGFMPVIDEMDELLDLVVDIMNT